MNKYGMMARDHWMRYAPIRYATLEDPEAYFTQLGESIAAHVQQATDQLQARLPADLPYLEKVGQLKAIQRQAEEVALTDQVYSVEVETGTLAEELEQLLAQLPSPQDIPRLIDRIHDQAEDLAEAEGWPEPLLSQEQQTELSHLHQLRTLIEGIDPQAMSEAEIRNCLLELQELKQAKSPVRSSDRRDRKI